MKFEYRIPKKGKKLNKNRKLLYVYYFFSFFVNSIENHERDTVVYRIINLYRIL